VVKRSWMPSLQDGESGFVLSSNRIRIDAIWSESTRLALQGSEAGYARLRAAPTLSYLTSFRVD
jgi:hypothetical protein